MMNFYEWLGTFEPVAKSKLLIAVHYWQKLRVGFETIFEDDYLKLSINLSERTSSKISLWM